jgi:hypothetical protein
MASVPCSKYQANMQYFHLSASGAWHKLLTSLASLLAFRGRIYRIGHRSMNRLRDMSVSSFTKEFANSVTGDLVGSRDLSISDLVPGRARSGLGGEINPFALMLDCSRCTLPTQR